MNRARSLSEQVRDANMATLRAVVRFVWVIIVIATVAKVWWTR